MVLKYQIYLVYMTVPPEIEVEVVEKQCNVPIMGTHVRTELFPLANHRLYSKSLHSFISLVFNDS